MAPLYAEVEPESRLISFVSLLGCQIAIPDKLPLVGAVPVQAIQSHGLSVQEYSNVVRTAQNNPQVKQRLLSAANSAQ